ncbi:MAG: copper resistance system multicopper oxidase [Gammaproteobacteria bacterium]|nr:copper resistance system multicopper oxidase [Gammaproteobacteria bacterium]
MQRDDMDIFNNKTPARLDRRRFVQGLGGSALLLSSQWPTTLRAEQRAIPEIDGYSIDLEIGPTPVNFTGKQRTAVSVNGSVPAPILRWREGDIVTIRVTNRLKETASIHWHGLILPMEMDGVPGLSYDGIPPGGSFTYQFPLQQAGTYWYHSHSGFQEQLGLYGAIVIEPREPQPYAYDRDYIVMLSDWTDENPMQVFKNLKNDSEFYQARRRTLSDTFTTIQEKGLSKTWRDRRMWNQMRMSDRDISDVTGATYTFLMNGVTPADQWRALFKNGEKVLLRFINAGAMTLFDVRIPGLEMTVVATDGQNIEPVTVDEFRIGSAETYDVIVKPTSDIAYAIFAQAIDRSGYAIGALTPDMTLTAEIPRIDPYPQLSMTDMGMNMDTDMDMSDASHAHHHHDSPSAVNHPSTENNFGVGMQASNPQQRLDDPGVGLRDRSWRVLTYSMLRRLDRTPLPEPEREIQLHLTGNMNRYMWSFNGVPFADAEPVYLKYGETVRITLTNDTMMHHPIHLHGMWSDLETGSEGQFARKHTITVQPGQQLSYQVTANAMGRWAFHCHLLYHMDSGMFRVVDVSRDGRS